MQSPPPKHFFNKHAMCFNFCFFQYPFPKIGSQSEVEQMIRSLPKYVKRYISVSCGVYLDDEIVMRHEFEKVVNLCEREVAISICGPKGCGKTYTLVLLFALCVHTSTRCILLTLRELMKNTSKCS